MALQSVLAATAPLGAAEANPRELLGAASPAYTTAIGAAYVGDSVDLLRALPTGSVDLVLTSPPYALEFQKEYGNATKADYVEWLRPFGEEIRRVLKDDGSFVLNIGGSYNPGYPTRSLYHFKVLLMLCEEVGFNLAQECFWHNPAKLPAPAEWVNVQRQRIKCCGVRLLAQQNRMVKRGQSTCPCRIQQGHEALD